MAKLAVALASMSLLLILASGPGHRLGLWSYSLGIYMIAASGIIAIPGAILGAIAWFKKRKVIAIPACILSVVLFSFTLGLARKDLRSPPIRDATSTLEWKIQPEIAFDKAEKVARKLRWEIVASDKAEGRLEGTITTFWFGLKHDVVVRIRPTPDGSQVDVRSRSRVDVSDLGANEKRVRIFLKQIQLVE